MSARNNYISPFKVKTQGYRSQTRKIILNVVNFFQHCKKNPDLLLGKPTDIAARALNVSRRAITSIIKTGPVTPKKRPGRSPKFFFDKFDKLAIRNIIKELYTNKIAPTISIIRSKVKERKIGPAAFSRHTLWRLVRKMGFQFKSIDRRIHLVEKTNLREWRRKFIQRLNQNAAMPKPRPVIYLDESWISCNKVAMKGWAPKVLKLRRDRLNYSYPIKPGKGPRLIMIHAGSKDGFVPGALLLKKSTTTDEDYHKEIDGFGFTNWFEKCLLPNIPPNSIIVMDNASYHTKSEVPKCNDKVRVMKDWLCKQNIQFPDKAIKKQIWTLVKAERKNADHYFIDKLAKQHGHEVMRLPPYHCDLNPIEMVWGHIKEYVAKYNQTGKIDDIMKLADEYIQAYPPLTWAKNVAKVERISTGYQTQDGFSKVPPEPGQILIPMDVSDTESEDDFSEDDIDSECSDSDGSPDDLDTSQNSSFTDTPQSPLDTPLGPPQKRRKQNLVARQLDFNI